jgi:hypothetical protein
MGKIDAKPISCPIPFRPCLMPPSISPGPLGSDGNHGTPGGTDGARKYFLLCPKCRREFAISVTTLRPSDLLHLHWLQIGDGAALKIRRHSVARFAWQDCDFDSILNEIENAVGRWRCSTMFGLNPALAHCSRSHFVVFYERQGSARHAELLHMPQQGSSILRRAPA